MIRLSNADARRLVKLLDDAQLLVREHALTQSYRRDACKFLRERILADYHDRQWNRAVHLADAMTEAGGDLQVRLDAVENAA